MLLLFQSKQFLGGNFPTVKSPNQKNQEALTMALALAENQCRHCGRNRSDRLGVAVRNNEGEMTLLNGNQTMVLMTAFFTRTMEKSPGKINGKQFR
jgi:hypothetical protein